MDPEGQGTFDVWEVGVDTCDLCDEVAVDCRVRIDPDLGLIRLCDLHAEIAARSDPPEDPLHPDSGATCLGTRDGVPCGATTTHVHLIGYFEGDKPEVAFWPLCRKHHEERTRPDR